MTATELERASPVRRGLRVWFAVFGGIGAWTVHLLVFASMARLTCNARGYRWVMHAATVVCLVVALAASALAARLVRATADGDESAATAPGRLRFLGLVGVLVGVVNIVLILLEETYSVFLHRCG